MIKKVINQNDILNQELLNIIDYEYIYENKPINRKNTKDLPINLPEKLKKLKVKIEEIKECDLKNYSPKIIFPNHKITTPWYVNQLALRT